MLVDISSGRTITRIPHRRDTFDPLRTRLGHNFNKIVAYIDGLIDQAGGEIVTAGWLPENRDWNGTPLQPIYDTAARKNYGLAGRMFGLIVWYTVMQRAERWSFGRYEKGDIPIESMTYFRVT